MSHPTGRNLPLSAPRTIICDLVHFAKQIPTVPVERKMNLGEVVRARGRTGNRVSWCSLFTKAYGRTAAEFPELRRAYIAYPWPRLYEHPYSIASVAIERQYRDEPVVFFVHLRSPETQPLMKLDAHLRRFKTDPVESVSLFRRALLIGKYPRFLRHLLWRLSLNWSGGKKAKRLGTFGVSVYSGLGAASLHPLSPLTTTLTYGVIDAKGEVTVRAIYDHRVMDGATVARALKRLEEVLVTEIVAELEETVDLTAAPASEAA
jgi:hypothetical protein